MKNSALFFSLLFLIGSTPVLGTGINTNITDTLPVSPSSPTFTGNVNFQGSGIWNSSGNVGIGTTSPSTKLDVNGSFQVDSGAISYDDTTGVTFIDALSVGSNVFDADVGIVSWVDLPVSATPLAGTDESYSAQIDGNSILTIYFDGILDEVRLYDRVVTAGEIQRLSRM